MGNGYGRVGRCRHYFRDEGEMESISPFLLSRPAATAAQTVSESDHRREPPGERRSRQQWTTPLDGKRVWESRSLPAYINPAKGRAEENTRHARGNDCVNPPPARVRRVRVERRNYRFQDIQLRNRKAGSYLKRLSGTTPPPLASRATARQAATAACPSKRPPGAKEGTPGRQVCRWS